MQTVSLLKNLLDLIEYQDGGVQYTVGEGGMNPFVFENLPKETPKEAEATVRNEFEKRTTEIETTL